MDRIPAGIVKLSGLAQFSPDGKWIAYQSDKTGRSEIYLRPFPGPGDEWRASIDGGAQARCARAAKFVRLTQTTDTPNAPVISIQRLRLYDGR